VKRLDYYWYNKSSLGWLLIPPSWLFRLLVVIRRWFYRLGVFRVEHMAVPVIVVGNITVGGTGKTPLVVWLVEQLKAQGYQPGIVSRGYGGKARHWPQQVRPDSDPRVVGDEAILLARRCVCPMAVGPVRPEAARALLAHTAVNVIVSDDGLQHYALGRDVEIAVVDGVRRFGNGHCLPAGPLREPVSRLARVDFVVSNGIPGSREYAMSMKPSAAIRLDQSGNSRALANFKGMTVYAVAGIGDPERFFQMLEERGLMLVRHAYPDHYVFRENDVCFEDDLPVFMTEKDAVKCYAYADQRHWFVPVMAQVDSRLFPLVSRLLDKTKVDRTKVDNTVDNTHG